MSTKIKTERGKRRRAISGVRPTSGDVFSGIVDEVAAKYSAWCKRRGLLEYDQRAYVAMPKGEIQ